MGRRDGGAGAAIRGGVHPGGAASAYETCAATKCTLTAKGNDNTPVEGAKVVVVLSGDGTTRLTWEGF